MPHPLALQELIRRHPLLCLKGAWQIARKLRRGQIVTLFPDIGERYLSTKMWDE